MREVHSYSKRTPLLTSNAPRRKYLLLFEGAETEPIYFDMIVEQRTNLNISSLITISPIKRSFTEAGWSNPKKIAQTIIRTLEIQESGKYPYIKLIEWITEYIDTNRILTIGCKNIQQELEGICINQMQVQLSDTVDVQDLDNTISHILKFYIKKRKKLRIEDLDECATNIKNDNQILFDSENDVLCLIVDRDSESFSASQYDEVVTLCREKQMKLFVSNPDFEFWLLLHFDQVHSIDKESLLTNPKIGKKKFSECQLKELFPSFKKTKYKAVEFLPAIPKAIENEKRFCEDIIELKNNVGSNVGILISDMQKEESAL